MLDETASNIVSLPFVAVTRAASAPALGRFGHLYGGSAAMQDVYRKIEKVAPTSATVLITGESGSGKEVVARTIHERSESAKAPFIAVNCGAIPET
jgi:DNA-binding NtrC family response regulator